MAVLQAGLVPPRRPGQGVIMDQRKAPKVAGGTVAGAEAKVSLLSLPPSSPALSPLEACWSKGKMFVRTKAARTRDALEQAIAAAFETLTAHDAQGWCTQAGYCVVSN